MAIIPAPYCFLELSCPLLCLLSSMCFGIVCYNAIGQWLLVQHSGISIVANKLLKISQICCKLCLIITKIYCALCSII